jgi:hypothetical protein
MLTATLVNTLKIVAIGAPLSVLVIALVVLEERGAAHRRRRRGGGNREPRRHVIDEGQRRLSLRVRER